MCYNPEHNQVLVPVELLEVIRDYVEAGPFGHREEPWSEYMLEQFIRPQTEDPDPFEGPPHPTCSACSKDNDPLTTKWAHEKFELWYRAKQVLQTTRS